MAIPALVTHTGSLSGTPAQGAVATPSLQEIINTSFAGTFGSSKSARPSIVNATLMSPFVLPFETITKCRCFALSVVSGAMTVLITTAAGTDQAYPVSGLWLWFSPQPGTEITSIKLVGTADVQYFLAGDVS